MSGRMPNPVCTHHSRAGMSSGVRTECRREYLYPPGVRIPFRNSASARAGAVAGVRALAPRPISVKGPLQQPFNGDLGLRSSPWSFFYQCPAATFKPRSSSGEGGRDV